VIDVGFAFQKQMLLEGDDFSFVEISGEAFGQQSSCLCESLLARNRLD
jgi:hypothetical protein